jgi:hypothetical protein
MNTKTQETLKMAGYNLDGVIADVENFDGFDDVCLRTIKRVRITIAKALEQPAQEPVLIQWYDEEAEEWEDTDERYYKHYKESGHKIRFLYTKEQL